MDASVGIKVAINYHRKNGAAACPHALLAALDLTPRPASTPPLLSALPPRSPSAQVLGTHPSPSPSPNPKPKPNPGVGHFFSPLHTFIDTDFLPSLELADVR